MPIRIEMRPDGPLLLTAENTPFPVLTRLDGEDIALEKPTALCRCGASNNKPYCDGQHVVHGYTSENRCDDEGLQEASAPGITVHFNRSICSGAAECARGLPEVFESAAENWIHPENAPVEKVIEVVKRCPSGAMTYALTDEAAPADEPTEVTVRIVKNGPYEITGHVEFEPGRWGTRADKRKFALCRCGKSGNAPFCDYSHGEQHWTDDA